MNKTVVLGLMMFLEFMMFPVWFVPIVPYVRALSGGESWTFWCGVLMGVGTITSPLIGLFADRYLNAEKVLALCYALSAAFLVGAFFVTSPALLFFILLAVMCLYMPTWSLTITIVLVHAPPARVALIRAAGTIGWIATGAFSVIAASLGFESFDASPCIFLAGAAVTLLGLALTFALPPTEPQAKGAPLSVLDALGLKALVLFKDPVFRPIALVFLFATVPYLWYLAYGAVYLADSGFRFLTLTLNLGQVGEIGFILLVPWLMKRLGLRNALVLAFGVIIFRNLCFAASSSGITPLFNFGGILVHGLIFGLISFGAQIFVNDYAPAALRNQAQGLMNVLMVGGGVFVSNLVFDLILRHKLPNGAAPWTTAYLVAVVLSLIGIVLALWLIPRKSKPTA